MIGRLDHAPRDHHRVLQADEGDQIGHHAHLAAHVEGQSGQGQGHEDGPEDAGHRADGDHDLGADLGDLLHGEVDVDEQGRQGEEKGG